MLFQYRVTYNPMFLTIDNVAELRAAGVTQQFIAGRVIAESYEAACEKLFELFNTGHQPKGMRSMSVGDFVALAELVRTEMDSDDYARIAPFQYFVCARTGWQPVHESEMITR